MSKTAIVLLASGLSSRFEKGDKLMAPLADAPVLARAAALGAHAARRFAVVGVDQTDRRDLLTAAGWTLVDNPDPAAGMGAALALGAAAVAATHAGGLLVALADMPLITDRHLAALTARAEDGAAAVFSKGGDAFGPPAFFARSTFDALSRLEGDQGARGLRDRLGATATVAVQPDDMIDVDSVDDLARATAVLDKRR
ncbi:MAG: NTP transferase domain-containing protein [Pseudomonadota bacterium]